jgi:lipoprotein-releasing system permease protein
MSRLPFELLLAFRYLRPKRTFVSVITLISIIGVTLGVAVLIIVISVMSGFGHELRETIFGFNAHLKVFQRGGPMRAHEDVIGVITRNPLVKGAAPFVLGQVLLESKTEGGSPPVGAPWVRGIDPKREGAVSVLPGSVVHGEFNLRGNSLVLGREFAAGLGLGVGDIVSLHSPRNLQRMRESRNKPDQEAVLPDEFVVRGLFDVGYYEYNASVVATSLANAQDLFDLDDAVQGLLVMLHDPFRADDARRALLTALGPDFAIRIWSEDSSMLTAVLVEKNVMFYLLFFIMIVAAFGITSVLITFVVQKTREIGVLKALGATNPQVMWLFLSQSVVVGVIGVLCGLGLGRLALAYRNEFLHVMNRVTGFELFPASIYQFSELPALIIPGDIAIICGGSLLICVLAGVLPAWNAGRLKPVEALRHE